MPPGTMEPLPQEMVPAEMFGPAPIENSADSLDEAIRRLSISGVRSRRSRRQLVREFLAVLLLVALAFVEDLKPGATPAVAAPARVSRLGDQIRLVVRPMSYSTPKGPAPTASSLDVQLIPANHVPDYVPAEPPTNLWDFPLVTRPVAAPTPAPTWKIAPAPEYDAGTAVDGNLQIATNFGYFEGFITGRRQYAVRAKCTAALKIEKNAVTGQFAFLEGGGEHPVLGSAQWGGGLWNVSHGRCYRTRFAPDADRFGGPGCEIGVASAVPAKRNRAAPTYLVRADLTRAASPSPAANGAASVVHLNLVLVHDGKRLFIERAEGIAEVAWPGYTLRRQFYLIGGPAEGAVTETSSGLHRTQSLIPWQQQGVKIPWTTQVHMLYEMRALATESRARCMVVLDPPDLTDRLWITDLETATGLSFPVFMMGDDPAHACRELPPSWGWLDITKPESGPLTIDPLEPNTIQMVDLDKRQGPTLPFRILKACLPNSQWDLTGTPDALRLSFGREQAIIPLTRGRLTVREPSHIETLSPWKLFSTRPSDKRPEGESVVFLSPPDTRNVKVLTAAIDHVLQSPLRVIRNEPSDRHTRLKWVVVGGIVGLLGYRVVTAAWAFGVFCAFGAFFAGAAGGLDGMLFYLLSAVVGAGAVGRRGRNAGAFRLWLSRWITRKGSDEVPISIAAVFPDAVPIARGGMGVIYRAVTDEDVSVIIKSIATEHCADGNFRKRFKREVAALQALDHPNIVRLLDAQFRDVPYFVMEDYPSRSLETVIDQKKRLTELETVQIGIGLARGLAAAHANGILHRDIKPSNILIGADESVRLIDFGLAWMTDATRVTQSAGIVGTLRYIAPETLAGQEPSAIAEIYAAGIVLYECLTNTVPLSHNVLLRLNHPPMVPPGAVIEGLSPEIDAIVMRCLAPPEARWATALELARALEKRREELDVQ